MSPLSDATPLIESYVAHRELRVAAEPIAREEYDAATEELLRRARGVAGLRATFDLGPVRFPGLSDLDVLFVLEDGFEDFAALRPLLRASMPRRHHRALTHNPFFVREHEYRALFQFAPILQLRPLWSAAEFGAAETQHNTDPIHLALYLADIIAESYPREFLLMMLQTELHEREVIARLKGLAYCFEIFERLGGTLEPEWRAFPSEIETLRSEYFNQNTDLSWALEFALRQQTALFAFPFAKTVARHFEEAWGVKVEGELRVWAARSGAVYKNSNAGSPEYTSVRVRHLEIAAQAPALFGWLVREYAQGEGPVSARLCTRIDDKLQVEGKPAPEIADAIARRIALRNAHAIWVDRAQLGLPTFLTFGYRSADARAPGVGRIKRALGNMLESMREEQMRKELSES